MKKLLLLSAFLSFSSALLSFSFCPSNSFERLIDNRKDITDLKVISPLLFAIGTQIVYETDRHKTGFILAPLAVPISLYQSFSGLIEKNAINAVSSIFNEKTAEHDKNLVFNTIHAIFGSHIS